MVFLTRIVCVDLSAAFSAFTDEGKLIILSVSVPDSEEVLGAAKDNANTHINTYAKVKRAEMADTLDDVEIAIWNNKLRIAQAMLAGKATSDELRALEMEIEAHELNESLDAFCERILKRGMRLT